MPRKKRDVEDLSEDVDLIPEESFEDAMRAVLGASNQRVAARMDAMQSSNKRRRDERKSDRTD